MADFKPRPGDLDYDAVRDDAARRLAYEFGLQLKPEDFELAWEKAAEAGYLPFREPLPPPDGETDEQLVLRLFVMASIHDEVFTAGATALRKIGDELAALPLEPSREDTDAAVEKVVRAFREKFTSLDVGGWAPEHFKRLVELGAGGARGLAENIFGLVRDCGREAAEAFFRQVQPVPGRKGRPKRSALEAFGAALATQWLIKRFPYGPSTEWSRCVSLMWVVSGQYQFGKGSDGNDDGEDYPTSEAIQEAKLDALLERAYRTVNDDLKERYRAMLAHEPKGPGPE